MADTRFYDCAGPLSLAQVGQLASAELVSGADPNTLIHDVAPLDRATAGQIAFCDTPRFLGTLQQARASAVFVTAKLAPAVPRDVVALICERPALAFAKTATRLYPDAGGLWPASQPPVLAIAATARIGAGTVVAPGVFIGEGVEIGERAVIGPGAVIGRGVQIGHGTRIGPHVSVSHALIGDHCIVHAGARIGQDGFGYVNTASGHIKIPQLGRVILQDRVEVGANTAIDRGALADTVIGEGTKIDNLVQIGHNNHLGRHCIIVSQVGISGSCDIEDFVVMGGQVGVADHVKIGRGVQVAGRGGVTRTLEGGKAYGGFPAKPVEQWRREVAALSRLGKSGRAKTEADND
jgi:UDP-3-O-[3-hydroxymyristoyl] glucosamine N-acyltransferase